MEPAERFVVQLRQLEVERASAYELEVEKALERERRKNLPFSNYQAAAHLALVERERKTMYEFMRSWKRLSKVLKNRPKKVSEPEMDNRVLIIVGTFVLFFAVLAKLGMDGLRHEQESMQEQLERLRRPAPPPPPNTMLPWCLACLLSASSYYLYKKWREVDQRLHSCHIGELLNHPPVDMVMDQTLRGIHWYFLNLES